MPGTRAGTDRPAGGLRPSQVALSGETAMVSRSPLPGGSHARHAGMMRPSGARADLPPGPARPSAVPTQLVRDVLHGSGQPLTTSLKREMEGRLGADFSDVRVHTGEAARASAAGIGARAYTAGDHVVLGDGGADKHTLAHELTHVIQQRQGPAAGTGIGSGLQISDPFDVFERAAEANAARVMRAPLSQHHQAPAGAVEQQAADPIASGGPVPSRGGTAGAPGASARRLAGLEAGLAVPTVPAPPGHHPAVAVQRAMDPGKNINIVGESHDKTPEQRRSEAAILYGLGYGEYWTEEQEFPTEGDDLYGDEPRLRVRFMALSILRCVEGMGLGSSGKWQTDREEELRGYLGFLRPSAERAGFGARQMASVDRILSEARTFLGLGRKVRPHMARDWVNPIRDHIQELYSHTIPDPKSEEGHGQLLALTNEVNVFRSEVMLVRAKLAARTNKGVWMVGDNHVRHMIDGKLEEAFDTRDVIAVTREQEYKTWLKQQRTGARRIKEAGSLDVGSLVTGYSEGAVFK